MNRNTKNLIFIVRLRLYFENTNFKDSFNMDFELFCTNIYEKFSTLTKLLVFFLLKTAKMDYF